MIFTHLLIMYKTVLHLVCVWEIFSPKKKIHEANHANNNFVQFNQIFSANSIQFIYFVKTMLWCTFVSIWVEEIKRQWL